MQHVPLKVPFLPESRHPGISVFAYWFWNRPIHYYRNVDVTSR